MARKRIPIIEWLPKYSLATLAQDTLAGFTVVLTLIPQGIAYAYVAGNKASKLEYIITTYTNLFTRNVNKK